MRRLSLLLLCALLPLKAFAVEVAQAPLGHEVEAWYAANDAVPVVHVTISFEGAGSASDPAGKAGRAALVAAMLDEGAGDLDSVAFQRALEDRAISLDIDSSDDRLTISIHALRDQAEEAGKLLALALSKPRFADADFARVRGQTLSLLAQMEESSGYQASRKFEEVAFAGHPYASPRYGTKETLAAIAPQDLRDYMGRYIGRGNMLITAGGDVDASLLKHMLAPVIEVLGDSEVAPVSPATMQGAGTNVSVAMAVPQSFVLFAAPGIARSDPRFYTYYLLNEILGGDALTSRLADGVRQKQGLVYSVSSGIDERAGVSLLRGAFASRTDRAAKAGDAVRGILADLRSKGVTDAECEDARQHVLGGFPLQLDSSKSVADILMMMRIHKLGPHYLDEREAKFRAVKCADINTVAQQLLAPEHFLFVTAGAP